MPWWECGHREGRPNAGEQKQYLPVAKCHLTKVRLGQRLRSSVCLGSQQNCALEKIFFSGGFPMEKKGCGYLNNVGKVSHPREVCLPSRLERSLPLTFVFVLAQKHDIKLFPLS